MSTLLLSPRLLCCSKRRAFRPQRPPFYRAVSCGAVPTDNAAFVLLATCAAAAAYAEQHTALGKRFSSPVLALAGAASCSALGLLPGSAHAVSIVWTSLLPVAVALSLLSTDLTELSTLGDGLLAFGCATLGTVIGTAVAYQAVGRLLGPHCWRLAACLCASYVGGSANFASVASAVGLSSSGSSLLVGAMAMDNLAMALFLALLLYLARRESGGGAAQVVASPSSSTTTASFAAALSASLCCTWLGQSLAWRAGMPSLGLAFVAVSASGLAALSSRLLRTHPEQLFAGAEQAAGALMLLFFASLGAGANIQAAAGLGGATLAFIVILLSVHLLVTLGLGRLLRLPMSMLLLASNAAVGGPATAAAMAAACGWSLLRPGLLLGCLGYAIGTPIGLAVGHALSRW